MLKLLLQNPTTLNAQIFSLPANVPAAPVNPDPPQPFRLLLHVIPTRAAVFRVYQLPRNTAEASQRGACCFVCLFAASGPLYL